MRRDLSLVLKLWRRNVSICEYPHREFTTKNDTFKSIPVLGAAVGHKKELNLLKFNSSTRYYSNSDSFTFKTVPNAEELRKLNHEQVLQLLAKEVFRANPAALSTIKKNYDMNMNDYPLNALNGIHLYNAIHAYETYLQSNGTLNAAKEQMIQNLMEDEKVTAKYVVETIATWLSMFTIEKKGHKWNKLASIKNEIDEKLKKMREVKPSLPPSFSKDKSEIRMIFRQQELSPSICFGPLLPANKYNSYLDFLKKEPKSSIFAVLILIEPSGYGKTHFMLASTRNGKFTVPFAQFFSNSKFLRKKITKMIAKKKNRSDMELAIQNYTEVLLETLNYCRKDVPVEEFLAILLFNGVSYDIAIYVDELCKSGYQAVTRSFNNVIFVLDEAHTLADIFANSIPRSNSKYTRGNAITLLTASLRQLAPVILMSTQRTFDKVIDHAVSGGNLYTQNSSQMNRLPAIEYGQIIPFLDQFINTNQIGQYEKLLMQQILQGQMRYLDLFIVNLCAMNSLNNHLVPNEIVRMGIGKLVSEFYATMEVAQLPNNIKTKMNSMTKLEAILAEMLIVFGKLRCSNKTSNMDFEDYLFSNGIGYAKRNENDTFYYRDLIISAKYQIGNLSSQMIARWVVELDSIVKKYNIRTSHLFELLIAITVCNNFDVFEAECKKSCFLARDLNVLGSKNNHEGQELRFASLLVSEVIEKSYIQIGLLDKLVTLPAEQNGPDFVTICRLNEEDYLCSASITLQSKDIVVNNNNKSTIEKIVKDFMKTNPWFYWIDQQGEVISKLDRNHIEKYLNLEDFKCMRLVFLPNISLDQVKVRFGVKNLKDLCSAIHQYWLDKFTYKNAFKEEKLEQILKQDEVVAEIDEFTVKTKRDRIIFVTQDHPFYEKYNNSAESKLLFQILSSQNEDSLENKQKMLELGKLLDIRKKK